MMKGKTGLSLLAVHLEYILPHWSSQFEICAVYVNQSLLIVPISYLDQYRTSDQTLGPIWKSRDYTGVDLENLDVLSRTN
jgi:hypothetical protein